MLDDKVDMYGDVLEFHRFYGANIGQKPGLPDQKRVDLRRNLVAEEQGELWTAVASKDMIKVADAIADTIYVLIGTAIEFGIPLDLVWRTVHNANMTKRQTANHMMDCALPGSPADNPARCTCGAVSYREDGKILKGPNFQSPEPIIEAILDQRGWVHPSKRPVEVPYDHTAGVYRG